MIEKIIITKEMLRTIKASAHRGTLNHRTLVDGEGNQAGRAGEIIVQAYLPNLTPAKFGEDVKGWDFTDSNGIRYDVKSKGNANVVPLPHFDCTVPEYQLALEADAYIFTRIAYDFHCGFIMGFISKEEFVEKATVRREGENYNNAGRATRGTHLVVPASVLTPISQLKENRD